MAALTIERCACAVVGAALLSLSGCRELPLCEEELELHAEYSVKVTAEYRPGYAGYDGRYDLINWSNLPSCDGFDGLAAGTTIRLVTTFAKSNGECREMHGSVLSLPSGQTWGPGGASYADGAFEKTILTADGFLYDGPCIGSHLVTFGRPDKDVSIFAPAEPGKVPSLLVGRSYSPYGLDIDGGPGCKPCMDNFVAELSKVAK